MVNKITTPPTQNEVIDKINELVDDKQDTISDLDKYLKNSAVSSSALSILGGSVNKINVIAIGKYSAYDSSQVGANSFNLGGYSLAGEGSVSLGNGTVTKQYSIGILGGTSEPYAIQIGRGTNSTSYTMSVGLGQKDGNNNYITYQLLNSSGKIPDDRLNSTIARTSAIPTVNNATLTIQKNGSNVATFTANASSDVTANISVPNTVSSVSSSSTNADAVGAKLFYDTCGDIETAINTIRGV